MALFCLKKWLDSHLIGRWKYDMRMKKIMTGGTSPLFSNGDVEHIAEMAVDETRLLGHKFERPTEAMKKDFIKDYGEDNQVPSIEESNLAIWVRYDAERQCAVSNKYVCLSNHNWYTLNRLFLWEKVSICLEKPEEWLFFKV